MKDAQAAAEDDTARQDRSAPVISEPQLLMGTKVGFLYNSIVFMSLFGLLGGLLGWACGEVLHFRPDPGAAAVEFIQARKAVERARITGTLSDRAADASLREIDHAAAGNPYYRILLDPDVSSDQHERQLHAMSSSRQWQSFIADTLFYAVCGMMIAVCLAIAEPVIDRNAQAAILNGSISAIVGLIGGVVVALFINLLYQAIRGDPATASPTRSIIARALTWGILGLFLTIGPGLVLRNIRKLLAGLVGGLVGGLLAGVLYELILHGGGSAHISRLVAIATVGMVSGLSTGLIENAAKSGWLRVTGGLIAGKQFILYRNPTLIGSSLQCTIYLFKDPQVGRRHAAIHIVRGGFELENFPLGGATYINGQPVVSRRHLRNNDRIQIGSTTFLFQEKPKPSTT